MLLALESAGIFWALLAWQTNPPDGARIERNFGWARAGFPIKPALAYLSCGILGLWTHYSFPIVLAAAGLAYLWHTLHAHAQTPLWRRLLPFVLINTLILLAYAPWLPIAVGQIRAWPKGGVEVSMLGGLRLTLQTLLFGPIRAAAGSTLAVAAGRGWCAVDWSASPAAPTGAAGDRTLVAGTDWLDVWAWPL